MPVQIIYRSLGVQKQSLKEGMLIITLTGSCRYSAINILCLARVLSKTGFEAPGVSVNSKHLFYDMRWRQDLVFSQPKYGFIFDVQRSEDFDGEYSRQLVGFRYDPFNTLQLWVQGDVFPDKSISDVYLSARYRMSDEDWLHFSWIKPDLFFNDKTQTNNRLTEQPQTFFFQWRQLFKLFGDESSTILSMNYSPHSELDSQDEMLRVKNRSINGAFSFEAIFDSWASPFRL